ncbi:hypothetical protein OQA88_7380 [Cercophora sp. LCS_1]
MATPQTHWKDAKHQDVMPFSLVIFIVSKLDQSPPAQHYPLAVAERIGGEEATEAVLIRDVLEVASNAVAVFSDEANRIGIQSEASLAAGFFSNANNAPPRKKLVVDRYFRLMQREERETKMPEFPFILTCLKLAAGIHRDTRVPLGSFFSHKDIEYAMVVLDISDLTAIQYGIVAFHTKLMLRTGPPTPPTGYRHLFGLSRDWGAVEYRVQEETSRNPVPAATYVARFSYHPDSPAGILTGSCDDLVAKLEPFGLIESSSLDLIWPVDDAKPFPCLESPSIKDTGLVEMIEDLISTNNIDIIDKIRAEFSTPHAQAALQTHLSNSQSATNHHSTGQLLGLAFTDETHLNLAPIPNLSADTISAALSAADAPPTSISLNLDTLLASASEIIMALTSHPSLKSLYLLQSPTRKSDHPSTAFFLALSMPSNQPGPFDQFRKIYISGAFSAPFVKQLFLPTTYSPPLETFPITHLFARGSRPQPRFSRDVDPWHETVYLGDSLLRPERFVSGFLRYIHALLTKDALCRHEAMHCLALAPASLRDIMGERCGTSLREHIRGRDRKAEIWGAASGLCLLKDRFGVMEPRKSWCCG